MSARQRRGEMEESMSFKKEFLWGASIAAHQCEGSFENDGKGRAVSEPENFKKPLTDFYHYYKTDIELFEEMGMQAFRMSIDWSRIVPAEDELPNQIGIAYYTDLFMRLKAAHIEPIVTLNHFETPYWVHTKYGGWENKETIALFIRYCRLCFEKFGKYVKYWLTFNEINGGTVPGLAYKVLGLGEDCDEETAFQGLHNQFVASAQATELLHSMYPESKMGCMLAYFAIYPKSSKPEDNLETLFRSNRLHHICGEVHCNGEYPYFAENYFKKNRIDIKMTQEEKKILKENPVDFVSISYYCSDVIDARVMNPIVSGNLVGGVDNEFLKKNDWGWHIDPQGFRFVLNDCYQRYKKPIAVVENGLGAYDQVENGKVHDTYRIAYLQENITEMRNAVEDGVDVFAYCMWSAIDIVSLSANTIKKRYGLIYVDVDDDGNGSMERIKKDSFSWYKKVIACNGEIFRENLENPLL